MARMRTWTGGAGRGLPNTRWSVVLDARDPATAKRAFDELIQLYWSPVYWLIRRRWGKSHEDAKDLVQEFFSTLLARGTLSFERRNARFRTFLRACVNRFMAKSARDARRLKRGGSAPMLSLDDEGALEPPAPGMRPDEVFDRAWARAVLRRAMQTVRERYLAAGKALHYRVLERIDLAPEDERPTHRDVSEELGLPVRTVESYLRHARASFRRAIEDLLTDTLATPDELTSELRAVFGA